MQTLIKEIKAFNPSNAQEKKDKLLILQSLENNSDIFTRENKIQHMTSSAWVLNESRKKTLMIYHNIYDSWSWLGGHADGEYDLLNVAIREVQEESGIINVKAITKSIFSLEVLTVDGHLKNGDYVSSHLHLNITYLLEADDQEKLTIKADENSGVAWFDLDDAVAASTETWFKENIYKKLNQKVSKI